MVATDLCTPRSPHPPDLCTPRSPHHPICAPLDLLTTRFVHPSISSLPNLRTPDLFTNSFCSPRPTHHSICYLTICSPPDLSILDLLTFRSTHLPTCSPLDLLTTRSPHHPISSLLDLLTTRSAFNTSSIFPF